jgi:hypothetical protein
VQKGDEKMSEKKKTRRARKAFWARVDRIVNWVSVRAGIAAAILAYLGYMH